MILRELHVRRFRALDDFRATFGPGLNLVRGPNEAGKSTLQAAIVDLLFADTGTQSHGKQQQIRSWGAETLPVLSASLSARDETFSVVKDFESQRTDLVLPDGTTVGDRKKATARIAQLAGFRDAKDEPVYRATACLTQQQWAQVSAGERLQQVLQASLTGGAEGAAAQKVLDRLDKATRLAERGTKTVAPKNPGPLARAMQERKQVEEQLADARAEVARLEDARLSRDANQLTLRQAEEELTTTQALSERVRQSLDLERELGDLRKRADEVSQRIEMVGRLGSEIDTLEANLAVGPKVDQQIAADVASWATREQERTAELREDRREYELLENERKHLEAEAERSREAGLDAAATDTCRQMETELGQQNAAAAEQAHLVAEHTRRIQDGRRALAPRNYLLAFGGLLVVAGVALIVKSAAFATLMVLGAILLAYALFMRPPADWAKLPGLLEQAREAQQRAALRAQELSEQLETALEAAGHETVTALEQAANQAERDRIEREAKLGNARSNLAVLSERIGEREAVVKALHDKLEEALEQAGLESVERLVEEAQAREKARRELRDRQQKLEGVLGEETGQALRETYRDLSLEVTGLQAQLESPELAMAHMSPAEYQELLARLETLRETRDTSRRRIHQAEADIAAARYDIDTVKALEGRREQLIQREGMLQERLQVLHLTREAIAQARDDTVAQVAQAIAPAMAELLGKLTQDRYTQVSLDSDMAPTVTCTCTDEALKVQSQPGDVDGRLSCATREQVFLAARLAIIDMLWPRGGPPLLLDDPLVNFDPARREAALGAIAWAARTRQVILFTCGHEYDELADHTVEMPAPT